MGVNDINLYHAHFYAGSRIYPHSQPTAVDAAVLEEFAIGPQQILKLTRTGNIAADFAADEAMWASVEPNRFYWFEGTNIIAQSRPDWRQLGYHLAPRISTLDAYHDISIATILTANPAATVVLFQVPQFESMGDAIAAADPRVDITMSRVTVVNPFGITGWGSYETSYRSAVTEGKLHAAMVSPSAYEHALLEDDAGPWWSIGIMAWEEPSAGRPVNQATGGDFAAQTVVMAPWITNAGACESCESPFSGRHAEFAAGVISRVLLDLRKASGHSGGPRRNAAGQPYLVLAPDGGREIRSWDIRWALERAAAVPSALDYDPTQWSFLQNEPQDCIPCANPPHPVEGQSAPWLFLGWGVLSADPALGLVNRVFALLDLADGDDPVTPPGFCEWQNGLMRVRVAYYGQIMPIERPGTGTENLYRFCGS